MKKEKRFLLILIFIYLFVRLYQLPQRFNFSMDQGTTLIKVYQLWQEKKLTFIGPKSSIESVNKHTFFHGPWIYYFLLPLMLVSHWEPLAGSLLFVITNLLALVFLCLGIKEKFGFKTALITGLFFNLSPMMINFSLFFWNPNFLPFCTACLIYLWIKISKTKNFLYFFPAGLIIGFGLSNHFLFILATIPFLTWVLKRKLSLKALIVFIEGLLIPFLPLILFELKHDFYNLKTALDILRFGSQQGVSFPPPPHYYLSLLPYFFLIVALTIRKIYKKSSLIAKGFILGFIIYSLIKIIPKPQSGYTMPPGWNYLTIKKTAQIILKENKNHYNVANLLYGDTRAYALRSLLTVAGKKPMKINEYPVGENLFVVSYKNKEEVIKLPTWEVSSFCPCRVEKAWKIKNNINLYLLKKGD